MLPEIVGLLIYILLFLATILYTEGWDKKPGKGKAAQKEDDDTYDRSGNGNALNALHFTGQFGAIARKWGKDETHQANLHYAAQIRTHPKHTTSRDELQVQLQEKYREYLRKGGQPIRWDQ